MPPRRALAILAAWKQPTPSATSSFPLLSAQSRSLRGSPSALAVVWYEGDTDGELLFEGLAERNLSPIAVKLGCDPSAYHVSYDANQAVLSSVHGSVGPDIRRFIFRRYSVIPQPAVSLDTADLSSAHAEFATREWEHAILGALATICHLAPKSVWLNPPHPVMAENKLLYLTVARGAGVPVPRTCLLRRSGAMPSWLKSGGVVIKPINGNPFLEDGTSLPTSRIDSDSLDALISARHLSKVPTMLQEHLPRAIEYRTFVIDKTAISVQLSTSPDVVDIRWSGEKEVDFTFVEPGVVAEKLASQSRAWATALGLRYAAVDHLQNPQHGLVAIDINPHGSWNWYADSLPGLRNRIHDAFAFCLEAYP